MNELKSTKTSDELKTSILKKLNPLKNIKVYTLLLDKRKIKNSDYDKNNLYNFVSG
ncbi:MAG: hypothetical protein LBM96_09400 [Methanobrevibacter sp.]|jgi:hypothetical protein|nr:hypothetical protein [Candidatus Methanoflexus mossambicus]